MDYINIYKAFEANKKEEGSLRRYAEKVGLFSAFGTMVILVIIGLLN